MLAPFVSISYLKPQQWCWVVIHDLDQKHQRDSWQQPRACCSHDKRAYDSAEELTQPLGRTCVLVHHGGQVRTIVSSSTGDSEEPPGEHNEKRKADFEGLLESRIVTCLILHRPKVARQP